ncbi:MarR family winged helix-turn-helix transcriptional regulator [Streptomyces sp. NPDC096205]|uniref:MarR family winged helix-turn-helix transcriptional regulator n=1 Tax=Streptomyces sp. NPDC096205 TaxID=3366081 RepID=UPI0038222A1E
MVDPQGTECVEPRLGPLLRQAQVRLARVSAEALVPFGVDAHEVAVLGVLAGDDALSQGEAAGRIGVDRSTMSALIDGLEDHGLVERRRSALDRRKNVVRLTPAGRECLARADAARCAAERRFLAPLGEETAAALLRALRLLTWDSSAEG